MRDRVFEIKTLAMVDKGIHVATKMTPMREKELKVHRQEGEKVILLWILKIV